LLWEPSAATIEASNLTAYERWLAANHNLDFGGDYARLWQWSVDELDAFWQSIWDHFNVISHAPPTAVLGRREMPGTQWFPGATLNYAEHIFRDRNPDDMALQAVS